jgi:hypothetical protein
MAKMMTLSEPSTRAASTGRLGSGFTLSVWRHAMDDIERLHPLAALRILQLIAPTGDVPPLDYPEPDNTMRCMIIAALLDRAALIVPIAATVGS